MSSTRRGVRFQPAIILALFAFVVSICFLHPSTLLAQDAAAEQAAKARCDQAETLLRESKAKEAQEAVAPFVKDPSLAKSKYRGLGLYYHGFASFLLKDYFAAGRSLNQLTPFTDPAFGTHARYLLARVHQAEGERVEAAAHYEGVANDYAAQKKAAAEALKQPATFQNNPAEKARLEALVREPLPDHVGRAMYYQSMMLCEDGQFGDAVPRLTAFIQLAPNSSLAAEARFRKGYCHVQLRQFDEAVQTLQPLVDKEPRLADQALLWIGKSIAGRADPNNPAGYQQTMKSAADTMRRAADKAQTLTDADAKLRRAEILLELADTLQLAKQPREAATLYAQLLEEKILPQRDEELLERQITALNLAGDYDESEKLSDRFKKAHPKSSLLPSVLFRSAENAFFAAKAAEKLQEPERSKEVARHSEEALKRYQVVVDKHPDFAYASQARFGLAMLQHRKGEFEKAKEILEEIPAQDRNGELAIVPFLIADCLIRSAPTVIDNALTAGRAEEELRTASDLLEAFINTNPNPPQTPDALMKFGYCQQRLVALLAQPQDKNNAINKGRNAYERIVGQFNGHPLAPQAWIERAKLKVLAGDPGGAINDLRRFSSAPLNNTPLAPMALLEAATLLRGQKRAPEAVTVLDQCRQAHEANLLKDPSRAGWVPLLQYHHAVALREAGKFPEARTLLEGVMKQYPNAPEATDAALRWGQLVKDEWQQKAQEANKKLGTPNVSKEEAAAATKVLEDAKKELRNAAEKMETQAEQAKQKQPMSEARARLHYEAAWSWRSLGDVEVSAVRTRIQQEQLQKLKDEVTRKTPQGKPQPKIPMPEVPLTEIPLQPSEKKAREQYQMLLEAIPDLPLAIDTRFELAELLADRNEYDPAVKLLKEALDKEPAPEMAEKIRLRVGACYMGKGDFKSALPLFKQVAQNPRGPLVGQARYRAGECCMQMSQWQEAARYFVTFRDQDNLRNLPGLSDRAMLRLGHALAEQKQWEASRQAHRQVLDRYGGNSLWAEEARFGTALAARNLQQTDEAIRLFNEVKANTITETAARAQLQIGLCLLDQKKYAEAAATLLAVTKSYDYPEPNAEALCEAARAYTELKQKDQAEKLLQQVIQDYAQSKWAKIAKQRLDALKKG